MNDINWIHQTIPVFFSLVDQQNQEKRITKRIDHFIFIADIKISAFYCDVTAIYVIWNGKGQWKNIYHRAHHHKTLNSSKFTQTV